MLAGPLTTSFWGLWVSGLLPPDNGGLYKKGGDPGIGHLTKGTTRTPGWHPEQKAAQLTQRGTLLPAWVLHQGEEPSKTPLRERERTQGPWRRGATCCCRLLRQLLLRYGWTVARVGPFVIFVSLLVKRTVELTACPVCSEGARLECDEITYSSLNAELTVLSQGQAFQAYKNEVYLLPKALNVYVTKLHIPHSVQS